MHTDGFTKLLSERRLRAAHRIVVRYRCAAAGRSRPSADLACNAGFISDFLGAGLYRLGTPSGVRTWQAAATGATCIAAYP